MTIQDIIDLINNNLSSQSEITAVKHRAVEMALLNFIIENIPLHKGTVSVGDVVGSPQITVTFPDLGVSDYIVVGSFIGSIGANNNTVGYCIGNKTATGFKLEVGEFSTQTQSLSFDYVIYKN